MVGLLWVWFASIHVGLDLVWVGLDLVWVWLDPVWVVMRFMWFDIDLILSTWACSSVWSIRVSRSAFVCV